MNTLPEVLRQTLQLSVSTKDERLEGFSELKATCPKASLTVGLHAYKLDIKRVTVDGHDASFELRPYLEENLPQNVLEGEYTSPEDAAATVADHAFFQYERTLQRESNPELLITLPPLPALPPDPPDVPSTSAAVENGGEPRDGQQPDGIPVQESQQQTGEKVEKKVADGGIAQGQDDGLRTLLLRVEYEIVRPRSGFLFWGAYGHTDNQVRRARAWFPCVDMPNAACPFDLRVTVRGDETAVAPGELIKQTWASHNRKTFHFLLAHATPPRHLALAVGPFAVFPGQARLAAGSLPLPEAGSDGQQPAAAPMLVTHFAPEKLRPQLEHVTKVFPLAFNLFETFLGAHFPFSTFHQVFVPAEGYGEEVGVAAGMCIASSDLLFSESTVEQAVESWLVLVRALARQWFGVWIRPRTPADGWLIQGLAAYLENLFLAKYLGRNEFLYRRHNEREAMFVADDGNAPPLYVKGPAGFPWGALHAVESLGPGAAVRRWKAAAVIQMLEQRAGEDNFKRLLSRLVITSCQPATAAGGSPRLLGTHEFLNQIVKAGGKESKHEISAFHQRWMIGRGCPQLTAALLFHRKKSVLELAIRQTGSRAARTAAEKVAAKEGTSAGIIKVLVKESEGPVEHPVHLGTAALKLVELRVTSKPAKPKMGKPGRKKKVTVEDLDADEDGGGPADGADTAGEGARSPVEWVRLDPHGEALAAVRIAQPEAMAAAQLERSKDVAAQSDAIVQLAALRPTTYGVVNALRNCLRDPATYCRIRVEAAMALAQTAGPSTAYSGLEHLLKYYRTRIFDSDLNLPRPWQTADLAEHYVDQALPLAIASVRDAAGRSFPEAAEALLEHLDHADNSGNPYSDDNALAALLEALGHLHLPSPEAMAGLVARLERYLQREAVMPSFQSVVGCAALASLTRLAVSMRTLPEQKSRLVQWLQRYSHADAPHHLRLAAAGCLLQLSASTGNAVQTAVAAVASERSPALRSAILERLLGVLHTSPPGAAKPGGAHSQSKSGSAAQSRAPSVAVLSQLHSLLSAHDDVRLRHLAFMALMRLGGLAPTLFREEEEFAAAGPAMSMEAGTQRQGPTASGQAISFDSGGRRGPVLKLRSSLLARTPDALKGATSEFSGGRSGEADTQQMPSRSGVQHGRQPALVDLTEISNRAPSAPAHADETAALSLAGRSGQEEQEAVSSPAVDRALVPKPIKLKFSFSRAPAAVATEPAKRKRDGAAEAAATVNPADAAAAKRRKTEPLVDLTLPDPLVPARATLSGAAAPAVAAPARAATPPVQSQDLHFSVARDAEADARARLPSPFAGPASQPFPQPQATAKLEQAKKKRQKTRTPPPAAVDPAAREALLRDVMAIAHRSATPPPSDGRARVTPPPGQPRRPTPQPRPAEASRQLTPPPAPLTASPAPQPKPKDRRGKTGAGAPAAANMPQSTPQAAPAGPAAKPKLKFKFGGAAASAAAAVPQPLLAPRAQPQHGAALAAPSLENRSAPAKVDSRACAPAAGPSKAKTGLKVKWSGFKGATSTASLGSCLAREEPNSHPPSKGKGGKQPDTEEEKQRRKQARLLKEKRSLGL